MKIVEIYKENGKSCIDFSDHDTIVLSKFWSDILSKYLSRDNFDASKLLFEIRENQFGEKEWKVSYVSRETLWKAPVEAEKKKTK